MKPCLCPAVLTIAGSDSCSGAGIQADLEVFSDFGTEGLCAVTCVTAQNSREILGIEPVSPDMVALQIKAARAQHDITAVKTGMLYSAETVMSAARAIKENGISRLVVDPVMRSTSGTDLLRNGAVEVLCSELFPASWVVTPNIMEAKALSGIKITSLEDMKEAALNIAHKYNTACVLKGGHSSGFAGQDQICADVLAHEDNVSLVEFPRIKHARLHGSGCRFSAAVAACLSTGNSIYEAVVSARRYVQSLLSQSAAPGEGTTAIEGHDLPNSFSNADARA